MRPLERLLDVKGSRLANFFRVRLAGLRAELEAMRELHPNDPGVEACAEALEALAALLRRPVSGTNPQPHKPPPLPSSPPQKKTPSQPSVLAEPLPMPSPDDLPAAPLAVPVLSDLPRLLLADPEVAAWAGSNSLPSGSDADLWQQAHRLFLRLPAATAQRWRARVADMARAAGAELCEDADASDCLPSQREEILCPALRGAIRARGLRTARSSQASDTGLAHLADAVAVIRYFLANDGTLHHAYKPVQPFGVVPATASRAQLEKHLQRRYDAVRKAHELSLAEQFRARLDLDELLASCIHRPPAEAETSWWGRWSADNRRELQRFAEELRQAGHTVEVRVLQGAYADIVRHKLTAGPPPDLEEDGPAPGQVAACLRVYASFDRDLSNGRVIFYSASQR